MPKKWLQVIDEAVKKIESDEIELGIQVLQKVQEHGKEIPEVMLYLADVWYQLGHLQEASDLIADMLEQPKLNAEMRAEFSLMQAEIALDEGNFELAEDMLFPLREAGYDGVELYLLLADLYAMQDLDEVAAKHLETALSKDPDNQEIKAALSEMYIRAGQFSLAGQYLQQLDEPNAASLLFHGRTLAQMGQFEQAYEAYVQAVAFDPTAEALYGAGLMSFHIGRLEEARQHVEQLLALDEEYVTAYPLLSDIYLSAGKTEAAIEALKQYVELSGFDLDHVKRLIALLTQAGRYEEAKQYQQLFDSWNAAEEEEQV
ncbi:tetratricopeptide repeat protein [Brevibacillus fluminis]|uniref:tetratricopeptide repeat protein n=1 Tax=Brevibacillus fluminis TaxID=511487 RepID=UPI003F894E8A